ncbi:MAG: EAL domain-containing protein, partial [Undibacterium sp.]|nr:EAL domain-containing protein [Undibacterium sp.]
NEVVLGLDTSITPEQMEARSRSKSTGLASATMLFSLAQHKGRQSGFLVLVPVYLRGVPLDSPSARRRAAIGETAAVFGTDHLISPILAARGFVTISGMVISVYSGEITDTQNLASQQTTAPSIEEYAPIFSHWLLADQYSPIKKAFTLAGTPWHIEISQASQTFTAHNDGSLYALLGGILSSMLAAAYVYTLVSRKAAFDRITKHSAELQFANLLLSEDVALRARTEKSLRLRERVIEVSSNAIIICNANAPEYEIEYVNPAFEKITGYVTDEVVGRSLESLQGNSQDQQNIQEIRNALREKREGRALLRNYRKDGTGYWNDIFIAPVKDDSGVISHFVVAQYDISAVMRFEAELEYQAKHDALTGLANRHLLRERLSQAIADADRNHTPIWILFIDVDRFKFVNDTLGHEAGDSLLKALAIRLQSTVRAADTVAHLGGDEFVLVLPDHVENNLGLDVIKQILDAVAQPLVINDHEFFLTCSIGVATYPNDGKNAESLIKHADIAMYRAKEMGRNTFQFYTSSMNDRTLDRLSIEADLRHALERGEFTIHYQPQIEISNGRIVGMEALLRWQHPIHGLIAPSRFISLAEDTGLIIPIGAWVLREACHQTKMWQRQGFSNLRVAVNLSARQFTQKSLVQSISEILHASELEPRFLELELTESMVMSDVENAIAILRNLKALGVYISIDDFGTGYSSLSYLRRFPIDVLKIDRSFVNDISVNADDAAIVVSIISLAHSLRLKVIAEGVETSEQLCFLREHACDEVQGYYFSKAISADAFVRLLATEPFLNHFTVGI